MKKFGIKERLLAKVVKEIPVFDFLKYKYDTVLNQEEIKHILQKNMQHVLVDMSAYKKFEKGDIVVCCDKQYELPRENDYGGAGWKRDIIFTIANLTDDVAWATRSDEITFGRGVYVNFLRYATEQEIKNYKNGKR